MPGIHAKELSKPLQFGALDVRRCPLFGVIVRRENRIKYKTLQIQTPGCRWMPVLWRNRES